MEYVETIDENSSGREMVNWLRGEGKDDIKAVVSIINRLDDSYNIPRYLNKEELLKKLLKVDEDLLWQAIDQYYPDESPCDEDEEENEDN